MIKYKFKCDDCIDCDGSVIEKVCESWVETIINGFNDFDYDDLLYGSKSTIETTFDHYQCAKCGEELRWSNRTRVQELELYAWLKERGEIE